LRAMLEMLHRLPASTDRASAVQIATSVRARMSEPPG
jgi:hypothetical protein